MMLRAPPLHRQRGLHYLFPVDFLHVLPAFRFFFTAFCITFCLALPVALRHFGHLLFLSVSSTSQNARQETHRRRTITRSPPKFFLLSNPRKVAPCRFQVPGIVRYHCTFYHLSACNYRVSLASVRTLSGLIAGRFSFARHISHFQQLRF